MALACGIIINKAPRMVAANFHARLTQTPSVLRNRSRALNILPDGVCRIELSRRKFALVDERDFEWLNSRKWTFIEGHNGKGYACHVDIVNGSRQCVRMHRDIFLRHNPSILEILGDVDHINQNQLDNRLTNLRLATRQQNSGNRPQNRKNTSGYKGVNFCAVNNSWRAQIADHGKKRHIGYYATIEEAALAYNEEAKKVFGEFAHLNQGIERTDFTKLQSARNVQPFRGVSFHKRLSKWAAYTKVGKRRKHLGYFLTKAEAEACFSASKSALWQED